jgi:hypothetical protein
MGVGVAVEVEVGAKVGEGVPMGGCALGDGAGVGVSVSGAGVPKGGCALSVGAGLGVGPTLTWREGAAVAGGGVASPGDCANEVEGW